MSTLIGRRVTVGRSVLLAVSGHRQFSNFSGQQGLNALEIQKLILLQILTFIRIFEMH